jgi:hypothetical protein
MPTCIKVKIAKKLLVLVTNDWRCAWIGNLDTVTSEQVHHDRKILIDRFGGLICYPNLDF